MKKKSSNNNLYRTFTNPDFENCWINSCLQMVLTAFEYSSGLKENGSNLWNELITLLKKGKADSLSPLTIRDIIITVEKERIRRENIVPLNRLFDLGLPEVFESRNHLVNTARRNRIGQQDCKDFFVCLSANRNHWDDVFQEFMVETVSFTTCLNCNHVSRHGQNKSIGTFLLFDVPDEELTMASFFEQNLNNFKLVEDWRDEDGCGIRTTGKNSIRIKNIAQTQNLIFVINRLIQIDGNVQITRKKVSPGGDICLKDVEGNSATFSLISIIHHSGQVTGNTTTGHYQADVLDREFNKWVRTSDNEAPIRIDHATDEGYIYLYKKN